MVGAGPRGNSYLVSQLVGSMADAWLNRYGITVDAGPQTWMSSDWRKERHGNEIHLAWYTLTQEPVHRGLPRLGSTTPRFEGEWGTMGRYLCAV